jgi:hypothetical protein
MNDDQLVTKDMEFAAFLRAHDVKIVDVRKDERNKIGIIFENVGGLSDKLKLDFYNHEDQVSASKLLWSYAQIKQLLFDANIERPKARV